MKRIYCLLFVLCFLSVTSVYSQAVLQESFEGTFPPLGWTTINNGQGNSWGQNVDPAYSYDGNKAMIYQYSALNNADAWSFTPSLYLNTNPVTITFFVSVYDSTFPESLKFTVGNNNTVAAQTTVLLDSNNITNMAYQRWTATFTPSAAGNYYFAFNEYSVSNNYNLYVDSVTISQLLPACSGSPIAGTLISSSVKACSNAPFLISVLGGTTDVAGLTYQWQSSYDSLNWSDITGETNSTYNNLGGLVLPTYYRRSITCGGNTVWSAGILVNLQDPALCVCSPDNGTILQSGTLPSIDSVSITGTVLQNNSQGSPSNGYSLFISQVPNLAQGASFSLYTLCSAAPGQISAWIDWNRDGYFDPATEYYDIDSSNSTAITNIQVPVTASLGNLIMRIRIRQVTFTSSDACSTFGTGETEDYVVNIIAGTPCSGKPIGGVAISPSAAICPNNSFLINVTGSTNNVTGLNYQWQISTDSAKTWSDINGEVNTDHTETGITIPTCYRRSTSCGTDTAYSSSVCVVINTTINCPCGPATGITLQGATGPSIDSVSIQGTSLNNNSIGVPNSGYTLYNSPATIPDLAQGVSYNLYTLYSAAPVQGSAWIDWNQDGIFDASEYLAFNVSNINSVTALNVPANAVLGNTIMRIRIRDATYTSADACATFGSGETEDYFINIIKGVNCTGIPVGGKTTADQISVCAGVPINFSVTGASSGTVGLTYQWQTSTDAGKTWNDIVGADSLFHYETGIAVPTWYRRSITCSGSTVYSDSVLVTINPAFLCACGPATGVTLHNATLPSLDTINILSAKGIALAMNVVGEPSNGYTLHNTPIIKLSRGVTYTFYTGYSDAALVSLWIDYNRDGIFDATEWTRLSTNTANSSVSVTIPSDATTDTLLMRIRTTSVYNTNGSGDACTTFYDGETEDFMLLIDSGVVCAGPPTPGTTAIQGQTLICANSQFTIGVKGATANQVGLTYQWQSSTDGILYNDIPGETNESYISTSGITDSMYYQRLIQCSGFQDVSTPLLVKLNGTLNTLPYVESFESLKTFGPSFLPNCWTSVATGNQFISSGYIIRNNIGARTGSNFVYAEYNSSAYLISPPISLKAGQSYTFSYYYRPTDPVAGFTLKALVANSNDTSVLRLGQIGSSIVNPVDTSKWILASYTYTPVTDDIYYFSINSNAVGFSAWYLNIDDINVSVTPLPVTMLQFKGEKAGNRNLLTWTTVKETNNKGFDVLHSTDGRIFSKIGFVATKADNGSTTGNFTYTFYDNQPIAGDNYYRLQQIDINGKETLTEIVKVNNNSNRITFTSIYPNPAKSNLRVSMSVPTLQNINILVTDISGRVVKEDKLLANPGDYQFNINVDGLPTGTYIIKVNCNNGCEAAVQKFVKQ